MGYYLTIWLTGTVVLAVVLTVVITARVLLVRRGDR